MALVLASDISAYAQTIFEGALLVSREQNLAAGLVTRFGDRIDSNVRSRSEYGTATINQIAETDDLASQAFTPAVVNSLTPYEYGAQFFVTDKRQEDDPFGARADAALELGQAMAEKIDTQIFGCFNEFTGGTISSSGTALTWSNVAAMMSIMRANKVPYPWYLVVHPYMYHSLGTAASVVGASTNAAPSLLEGVQRSFWVASFGPVQVFTSVNTEMATNDGYAGMFHPAALALDIRRAPRLEPERDASRRGIELNLSAKYAYGVWRPKWGVYAQVLCTAPTG